MNRQDNIKPMTTAFYTSLAIACAIALVMINTSPVVGLSSLIAVFIAIHVFYVFFAKSGLGISSTRNVVVALGIILAVFGTLFSFKYPIENAITTTVYGSSKEERQSAYREHITQSAERINTPLSHADLAGNFESSVMLLSQDAFDAGYSDALRYYSVFFHNDAEVTLKRYERAVSLNMIDVGRDRHNAYGRVRTIANAHNFGGPFRTNVRRNERGASAFYADVDKLLVNHGVPPMPSNWEVNNKRYFDDHFTQHYHPPYWLSNSLLYIMSERLENPEDLRAFYNLLRAQAEAQSNTEFFALRRNFTVNEILENPLVNLLRHYRSAPEHVKSYFIPPVHEGYLYTIASGLPEDVFRQAAFDVYMRNEIAKHNSVLNDNRALVSALTQQFIGGHPFYYSLVIMLLGAVGCITTYRLHHVANIHRTNQEGSQ